MGREDSQVDGDDDLEMTRSDDGSSADIQQYRGSAFPLKVTGEIYYDDLLVMVNRYSEAYEREEAIGREWRIKRDKKRAINVPVM